MGVTVASTLLGLLLGAIQPSACPDVVSVRGDDPAMVDQLSQGLLRSGIVAARLERTPQRCRALDVYLEGLAPPYTLSLRGPGTAQRTWQVHLVDLAVAMVESELGTVRPPAPPVEDNPAELIVSLRTVASMDGDGFVYLGPGIQAALCGRYACLDALGHYATGIAGPLADTRRQDVAIAVGPSLRLGDRGWGVQVGTAVGVRWIDAATSARLETDIPGLQDSYPYGALHEHAVLFGWQLDVGAHGRIAEDWSFDGQVSLQLMPEGGQSIGPRWVTPVSDVVVRVGLGVRWWAGRP